MVERKRKKSSNGESRYRELIELAVDGILLGSMDGTILEANSHMCELAGVPKDVLVGKNIRDVLFTKESIETEPFRFDLLEAGQIVVKDRTIRRPDGTEVRVEMRSKMMPDGSLQSIYRDITARKLDEERLQESEQRFRTLFETMAQGVVHVGADAAILSVNAAAERILGFTAADLIGRPIHAPSWSALREDGSSVPVEDFPAARALRTGTGCHDILGIVRPGGETRPWISVHAAPLFLPGESVPYQVFVTFEDITRLKKADADLQRSLKEKDVLMKELQHRVKNSLQLAQSLLSLEAGRLDPSHSKEVLLSARSRIHGMALFFERLYRSSEVGIVDLDLYIKDFLDSIGTLYSSEAEKIRFSSVFDSVKLDLKRTVPVCLILNELIFNAVKYAYPKESGGTVHVSLRRSDDNEAILTITDNGRGFPPGFDRTASSGLGLLLVHMLTEQIGGTISLGETFGGGATAQLQFALRTEKTAPESRPDAESV